MSGAILRSDSPDNKQVVMLNPRRLAHWMVRTGENLGAGVLTPDTFVVSTIPAYNHLFIARDAGIDLDELCVDEIEVGKDLRLQLGPNWLAAELWVEEDCSKLEDPPVSGDELQPLVDWMRAHPCIRDAYRGVRDLEVGVNVLDPEGWLAWCYTDTGFERIAERDKDVLPKLA